MQQIGRGVAQPGSAPVLGTGGRKFESCLPDQFCKDIRPDLEPQNKSDLCPYSAITYIAPNTCPQNEIAALAACNGRGKAASNRQYRTKACAGQTSLQSL